MKQRPYVILVGIDFEPDGDLAFFEAVKLAASHESAEVHMLHVGSGAARDPRAPTRPPRGSVSDQLADLARARSPIALPVDRASSPRRIVTHHRVGHPARNIVDLAADLDADVIVVGTHNRTGLKRLFLGSVSETVAHDARCPVLIVRRKNHLELVEISGMELSLEQVQPTVNAQQNGGVS